MNDEQRFASGFVEAALFADTPDSYEGNGLRCGLASADAENMRSFARAFYNANESLIVDYPEGVTQAGHDLWFTCLGHGCGYWEGDDASSKALNAKAKALGYVGGLYEGDDGLLYWEGA